MSLGEWIDAREAVALLMREIGSALIAIDELQKAVASGAIRARLIEVRQDGTQESSRTMRLDMQVSSDDRSATLSVRHLPWARSRVKRVELWAQDLYSLHRRLGSVTNVPPLATKGATERRGRGRPSTKREQVKDAMRTVPRAALESMKHHELTRFGGSRSMCVRARDEVLAEGA